MNINITLVAQIIAFVVLVWLVSKYLWTPLAALMEARRQKIADGLSASERGKHELKLAQERSAEMLRETKEKANDIVAQANARANQILEDARVNAKAEAERIVAQASAEIDREVNRAKETLRTQVSAIAVTGAERILKREVTKKDHEVALADLIAHI
ncbi:F0F1 ATP synthase subunit B [Halothiobacillus sp.]|uniref:F0F1 ATP synthase subunit B n=1 Tax=Halothiobacillus sp. TaxID=1891311 RepID=UPI00260B1265|nr:F0F1 ATP synthase subunit B [Halothiobacillus sp.]